MKFCRTVRSWIFIIYNKYVYKIRLSFHRSYKSIFKYNDNAHKKQRNCIEKKLRHRWYIESNQLKWMQNENEKQKNCRLTTVTSNIPTETKENFTNSIYKILLKNSFKKENTKYFVWKIWFNHIIFQYFFSLFLY